MYGYGYQYSAIVSGGGGVAPFVGLLDTYSGAAAAYSLRKLRNAYSGDAIKVRRSSDNAELNIGFVSNELDTAALTTFASGTDAFVTTWYDQSGNGRNQTQPTASKQPQIVNSGTVILNPDNNKPSILLDGTDEGFSATVSMPVSQRFESFSVLKTSDTQGIQYSDNTAIDRWVFILQSGSSNALLSDRFAINNIYKNNVLQTLTTRGGWFTEFANNVTHLSFLQGQININQWEKLTLFNYSGFSLGGYSQEIVCWFSSVDNTTKEGISNNINSHYGIY